MDDYAQYIESINLHSSHQEVAHYIRYLKLGRYRYDDVEKHFLSERIDGSMFLYLEKADLSALGVIQPSRRNALYDHIVSLRERSLRKTSLNEKKLIFRPCNETKRTWASITKKDNNGITNPFASILYSPDPIGVIGPTSMVQMTKNSKSESISTQFADILSSLPTMSVSLDLNNTQKLEKKYISSPGHGIKTEYCPYMTMKSGVDCLKFIAVYRGVSTKQKVWVLMDANGLKKFNEIVFEWSKKSKQVKNVRFCIGDCATQIFTTSLFICKLRTGWQIGGTKFPYNPIVVCTYSMRKNELLSMLPMDVNGYVNNIDQRGLIWVVTQLRVKALEIRNEESDFEKTGRVSKISFEDNRNNQFPAAQTSYLVHDWTDYKFDCVVGEKVTVCMKLSTKTNQRRNGKNQRPVFVQVWNLRNDPNLCAENETNYAAMPYTNQFSAANPDYTRMSNFSLQPPNAMNSLDWQQQQMMYNPPNMPMQAQNESMVMDPKAMTNSYSNYAAPQVYNTEEEEQQQTPMQHFRDPALTYNNRMNIPMPMQQNGMMDPNAMAINYNDYTLAQLPLYTPTVPQDLITDIVQSCAEEQKEEKN